MPWCSLCTPAASQFNCMRRANSCSRTSSSPEISLFYLQWSAEEVHFADVVIEQFALGLLRLKAHTTLRSVLSTVLQCDPMRISVRFDRVFLVLRRLQKLFARGSSCLQCWLLLCRKSSLSRLRLARLVCNAFLQIKLRLITNSFRCRNYLSPHPLLEMIQALWSKKCLKPTQPANLLFSIFLAVLTQLEPQASL